MRETHRNDGLKMIPGLRALPRQYSKRRSTLIVACTAAVKLLELIESRALSR